MAFGSLKCEIMDFGSNSFQDLGLGQMLAGFVCFEVEVVEVSVYDHLPGQGEFPALSTLQVTRQLWKKERIG